MSASSPSLPRAASLAAVAGALGMGTACGVLVERPSWLDQLQPDSPCYQVDLLDGLDESSTEELHNLFGCLNHNGHFEPLAPTVAALEQPTRSRGPGGTELARWVNTLPSVKVDPFALAGLLARALVAEDRPLEAFLDVGLEAVYGVPAVAVRSGEVDLDDPDALSSGLLVPMSNVIPLVARTLLDDDLQTAAGLGELLANEDTRRWVWTVEALARSEHPEVAGPVQNLLPHLGEALAATRTPTNDLWEGATGNSLRDAVNAWFLQDEPAVAAVSHEFDAILQDPVVRAGLGPLLVSLDDRHHLASFPEELAWMSSIDVDVQALKHGGDSALYAFIRLLATADAPVECSLDLWVTNVELIQIESLALETLELLADMDPELVQWGTGVVGLLFDDGIGEWTLHAAVDAGGTVCTGLTHEIVDDLEAVDVLQEPEATNLLVVFIEALHLLKYAESDQLPTLVALASDLLSTGALEPTEQLIRDVGSERLLDDLVALVPVLAHPEAYAIRAHDLEPIDLEEALEAAHWLFRLDQDQAETGWERARALLKPTLASDDTWVVLGRVAELLQDPRSQLGSLLDLVPALVGLDPELAILDQLGPLLANDRLARPLLELIESEPVVHALLAVEPHQPEGEVPLAFAGRLVVRGTLDDLLRLADLMLGMLGSDG